jgi:hypothetical protein
MPTPQQISQRKFWRSKLKQTDYATATDTATAANFKQMICSDKALADAAPTVADNKGYATGHVQATEQWIVAHEAKRAFTFDVCSEEAGRDLYDAFGKVVTTQPDVGGNPTVYQHVFSLMDLTASLQLPARTLVEQLGAAIDRKFPSCICESWDIKGQGSQRLQGSIAYRGSGKLVSPSGLTGVDLTGLHYFFQSQVTLKLDDGSTVTNMATAPQRVNSWSFGVANAVLDADGYRPGAAVFQNVSDPNSGEVRSELLLSEQTFSFSFDVRLLSNDALLAALLAQTPFIATIDVLGPVISGLYNHKLSIKAYKVAFKAIVVAESNGIVTLQITPSVMYDLTANKDVEVTLINTVASYTS